MSKTLLIVGGTGFIGRSLAEHSVQRGFKTIVLSLTEPKDNIKLHNVTYIQADITSLNELRGCLPQAPIDYVVNLSGYINHADFLNGGRETLDTHFIGVQNLLQIIDWRTLRRFVQIGTSDEYGNQAAPQNEEMSTRPISSYSVGKTASTLLLQTLCRTEALPSVVLRLFLVYGPGQNNKRFLPQIINGCLSNAVFSVSAGQQLRDFCYIDDVVDGIFLCLENDNVNGEVINLASGRAISIREAIEYISETIDGGNPEFGKIAYRAGENMELYADISKAQRILDWKPKIKFEDGVNITINHYRKEGN